MLYILYVFCDRKDTYFINKPKHFYANYVIRNYNGEGLSIFAV